MHHENILDLLSLSPLLTSTVS